MKLTAFTDYSLRVLMYLGLQDGRTCTVAEVANAFAISEHHLTKVAHFLGRQGLLHNVRGKGGGITLALPACDIRVGEVIRLTEGVAMGAECFSTAGSGCTLAPACRLRDVLAAGFDAFYAALDRFRLSDLIADRSALGALLPAWTPVSLQPHAVAGRESRA